MKANAVAANGPLGFHNERSLPEPNMPQHQWEAVVGQTSYLSPQNNGMAQYIIDLRSGSLTNVNDPEQLPDMELFPMSMLETSFDNAAASSLPGSPAIQEDLGTQTHQHFAPENSPSLVCEIYHHLPPDFESQAVQDSQARAVDKDSEPILQTHQATISSSDLARKQQGHVAPAESEINMLGEAQGQGHVSISSHTVSERQNGARPLRSKSLGTQTSDPTNENIEARFKQIFNAIKEAGFDSFDDMSIQYYTAKFEEDTEMHWAQSRSRNRSLYSFLASLHTSAMTWTSREVQGYRQQIAEAAETLYVSELMQAKKEIVPDEGRRSLNRAERESSPQQPNGVQDLWQIISKMERNQDIKREKRTVRRKVRS